jgi:beta-phosphoglucomutase-like phosphatase (HAD superfamily)
VYKIEALLFDMDGVVLNSNPLHRDAWTEYNLRHGIVTTPEMRLRISGKRNDEVVRDFFGANLTDEEIAAHGRAKEALYRSLMGDSLAAAILPGIETFLGRHFGRSSAADASRHRGNLKTALVTNAESANVNFVLDGTGLRRYFDAVVTGDDVQLPKPHPDIYLRAAELLRVTPAKCVVFEDSPTGVAAALAAGMRVVGVATSEADLAGASWMVADFTEPSLEAWLETEFETERR